jgi:prepilin-type processing-associated H-X9-DG protein
LSVDMMANNFFTHEVGKKKGVNALYGDGSVSYCFNREVFGHSMWDEGKPNINGDSMKEHFRKVILGIEGKTAYMSTIP